MKVSTETVATKEIVLTIEPDQEPIREAMRRAARQISRWRPVPGFRPGRAPYAMVERVFGREVILNQALDEIAPDLYKEAIDEAGIEPLTQGQIEVDSEDPLVLKVNVSLAPTVELGDYESLSIEPEPETAVTQEQIDEQLERVRRQHAEYEPVERPVQFGDQVVADIEGVSDGEQVIDQENAAVDITEEMTPPGFGEALIGMDPDETREFSLTYPEDYEDENLAGREVDLTVTVKTIREVVLPELDDDLAKMAGDYDTLEELREGLADQLTRQLERQSRQREVEAAISALVEQATVEYPEAALEREIDLMMQTQQNRLQQMGFDFQNYLRMTGQSEQQLRDEYRPRAEASLVERLTLMEFAKAEELKVSDEELQGELGALAASISSAYGDRAQEVFDNIAQSGGLNSVYGDALLRKAMDRLVAKMTGREEELETEEALEEPAAAEAAEAQGPGDETPADEAAPADTQATEVEVAEEPTAQKPSAEAAAETTDVEQSQG